MPRFLLLDRIVPLGFTNLRLPFSDTGKNNSSISNIPLYSPALTLSKHLKSLCLQINDVFKLTPHSIAFLRNEKPLRSHSL